MNALEEKIAELHQQIASRDRRRAEFVGTVSHDLKTPLNAIVGFTSVLLADAARLDPEQVHQLRLVYESARSLLGRINDLLEFHRIEAGRIQPRPAWLQPAELVAQVAGRHAERCAQQQIELRVEPGSADLRIRSDAQLIQRVLDELVANAIRFGGPGVTRLQVRAPGDGPAVRLSVSDPGAGWSADKGEQIMRALDPKVAELERSYDGLGLGLALAREAARLLGGHLEVAAGAGRPTRLSLVLDLDPDDVRMDPGGP